MTAVAHEDEEARAAERLRLMYDDKPGLVGWLSTVDHKRIGKRYLVTALAFLVVGGLEALVMRLQLSKPNATVLTPEGYNRMLTMHGITMILWYAQPILSAFGNYLIPMQIGARDMAYPRLNAFSYWTFLLSGLFLYLGPLIGTAPDAGWFAYAPLSGPRFSPGLGMDFYCVAIVFLTVSTTVGAINFITTILRHRAPGMTLTRMPLMMWSTLTTSFVVLFALPPLTVACVFLELERAWGFQFFSTARGGDPLLWQHLFWFWGHPWVYVVFLPATGMISTLLPAYCRRPLVAYKWVAASTVMTGLIGFSVWVHHMFATGENHGAMTYFSAASMVISVFSTLQVIAWLVTIAKGRVVLRTAMLFALGFIGALVLGGLSGVATALIPLDWQVHDTYFVVGHLHYVLVGANVFPVFAALYHWFPKITGRMLDERLGRVSFWLMFVGFNLLFFPMHILGVHGMTRRIYTYSADRGWGDLNMLATIGAMVLGVGVLVSVLNFVISLRRGPHAGKNPYNADTLEWSSLSPPPSYGTVRIPTVVSRSPLWDEHDEEHDPRNARILDQLHATYSTSARKAEPLGVALMPGETMVPLATALAVLATAIAFVFRAPAMAIATFGLVLLAVARWLWPKPLKHPDPPIRTDEERTLMSPDIDTRRGTWAMWCFIGTEAMLFVALFFAWFMHRGHASVWPAHEPPKLHLALPMLAILLVSSVVLHAGERFARKEKPRAARLAVIGTLLLGAGFVVLQVFEYIETLSKHSPRDSAYDSLHTTITSFHALHVLVGLAFLAYALFLPRVEDKDRPPHRALHNAALYWHFVDVVWIAIVAFLYVGPNL